MTGNAPLSIQEATELLRRRRVVLRQVPGAYTVNFRDGRSTTEYRTDDLDDALAHGLTMGEAPAPEPPLGPMGKGPSQRGKMIAHNRKVAGRRRKRDAKISAVQTTEEINT